MMTNITADVDGHNIETNLNIYSYTGLISDEADLVDAKFSRRTHIDILLKQT
jgi:hypothetical protein